MTSGGKDIGNIEFQSYVNYVKNNKLPLDIFVRCMKDLTGKDAKRMEKLNSILLNEFCNLKAENERLAKLNETMDNGGTSFSVEVPDPQEEQRDTNQMPPGSEYTFKRFW